VPPFGHSTQLRVFVDPDLLQYDPVDEMCGLEREHGTIWSENVEEICHFGRPDRTFSFVF
jgi:prolyl-tRNA editing enzyme YbaK/EbsC (Cys-tRNA(Pro) deacylase)